MAPGKISLDGDHSVGRCQIHFYYPRADVDVRLPTLHVFILM